MRTTSLLAAMAVLLCLITSSCKKNSNPDHDTPVSSYFMLKPGNYWIYETYIVDTNGNAEPGYFTPGDVHIDSVYVEKDTMINNHNYHKVVDPEMASYTGSASYLRDSAGYEINSNGNIILAPTNYYTIFSSHILPGMPISSDSAITEQERMADQHKLINVPAGSYNTIALAKIWTFYPFNASGGRIYSRGQYARYSAGVGRISETLPFYTAIPTYIELRLLRYHLN